MALFLSGELKGQKKPSSARLVNKPIEFKQHYFETLHALSKEQQKTILTKVIRKELSIWDMMSEAKSTKSMNTLKDMFIRVTNKDSWEAVQVGFPKFATEERLKSFTGLIKGVRPEVP
jgi:hypothetical protein